VFSLYLIPGHEGLAVGRWQCETSVFQSYNSLAIWQISVNMSEEWLYNDDVDTFSQCSGRYFEIQLGYQTACLVGCQ